MKKRWLAAVLCLSLAVGLLPGTALAADGEPVSPWEVEVKDTNVPANGVTNEDGYGSLTKGEGDSTQIALIDRNGELKFPYRSDADDSKPGSHGLKFYCSDGIVSLTTGNLYLYGYDEPLYPRYYNLDGSIAIPLDERVSTKVTDQLSIETRLSYLGGPMIDGYAVIMDAGGTHSTPLPGVQISSLGDSTILKNARIIDKTGKVICNLPDKFAWSPEAGPRSTLSLYGEGLFAFYESVPNESSDRYDPVNLGYMDIHGNTVLDLTGHDYINLWRFDQGLALVEDENEKFGFIDKTGKEVIPCLYEACSYDGGLIAVKKDGKWGFIDSTGKVVIPFQYDDAFAGPEGFLSVSKNGKYGLIDTSNRVVQDFIYDDISEYIDGVAYAVKDGKVFTITAKGKSPSLSDVGIYTISFDTAVTSVTVSSQRTGIDGTLSSLPSLSRDGFNLDGWFTAKEGGEKVSTSYVFDRDTTVYARWTNTGKDPVKPDDTPNTPNVPGSSSSPSSGGTSKPSIRPGAGTTKPSAPNTPTTNTPSASSFSDVRSSDWHAAAVNYVVSRGIMNGTGGGAFSPNAITTRSMVMTMLARLSGVNTDGGSVWYEKGMQWAKEQGISDGSNPNGAVSREQLVTMLYRSMNSPAAGGALTGFPDVSNVSSWAADAMAWAVANGLIQGDNHGALNPGGSATRAEVATILMRYCEKFGK